MSRRTFASIVALTLASVFLQAQSVPRFEIGAQTSLLRTFGAVGFGIGDGKRTVWSVGPAFTVNLNHSFAVDGAFTYSSQRNNGYAIFNVVGGDVTQATVGLKSSIRGNRFSFFAKGRSGYIRFAQGEIDRHEEVTVAPGQILFIPHYKPRVSPILDLGGGVEYAITSKLAIRSEMGDTVIFWRQHYYETSKPPTTQNIQFSNGLYYRFGRTIDFELPKNEKTHTFFDRTNVALFSASLFAQTADAVTTQRFMANCRRMKIGNCDQAEANPLARPFVKHGWGGQVALGAIVNATQLGVTYAIHKLGHHRVERFVTVPLTVGSGVASYKNRQAEFPDCRSGNCVPTGSEAEKFTAK